MELQYISDSNGNHTAIVIPINEWNHLKANNENLISYENPQKKILKKKPSDFVGCISKETADKMNLDIELSRNQWERNI